MRKFIFLFIFCIISSSVNAQVSQSVWIYSHTPGLDEPKAMVTDKQGNVIITGVSTQTSLLGVDYATIKYSYSGTQQWVMRYESPDNDTLYSEPFSIAADRNGNIYVTGVSSGIGTAYDILTIKYDPSGMEKWVRRYNGPDFKNDYGRVVVVDSTGSIYVGGSVTINNQGRGIIIKYDTLGNQIWANLQDTIVPYPISCDPSGNLYISRSQSGRLTLAKIGPDGNQIWRKYYVESMYNGNILRPDRHGNIYVTGWIGPSPLSGKLLKFNSNGDLVWNRTFNPFGNSISPLSLNIDNNDGIIIGTSGKDTVEFGRSVLAVKYDSAGNFLWSSSIPSWDPNDGVPPRGDLVATDNLNNVSVVSDFVPVATDQQTITFFINGENGSVILQKIYGGAGGDIDDPVALTANVNGTYVLVNSATTPGSFFSDFATVRYYDLTNIQQSGAEIPDVFSLYQNYPNPFNPETTIRFDLPSASDVKLSIYNSLGVKMEIIFDGHKSPGQYSVKFNGAKYPSGIYFYKLNVNGLSYVRKMALIK